MNRIVLASLTALSLSAALSTAASADEIDRRQSYQQQRIQQGLRSGEITRFEAARLQAEQARIAQMERRAEADGRVDRREAAAIRNAQNEASRHIYQESHDSQKRGNWFRRWW